MQGAREMGNGDIFASVLDCCGVHGAALRSPSRRRGDGGWRSGTSGQR
jgi:hypothetical protein